MSKQVNIQDSLVFNPTGYTGASNLTGSSQTNGYHSYSGSASTSNSSRWTTSTTAGYVYYTFSVSGIPSGATITSVSCIAKIWVNNTSRVSNTNIALYRGTTSISSSSTFASTSTSNTVTLNATSIPTVSQASDLRIRFGGTKASNQNTGYIYFYGADLTINYTVSGTAYEITAALATNNVDSISPAGYTEVFQGETYELTINADSIDNITVEDNGVDVTNQLVRHTSSPGGTLSKTAASFTTGFSGGSSMNFYTSSSSTGNNFNYAVGNTAESPGSTSSGSGSWTYVKENGSSTSNTGYADFVFDFSDIPANATITSVEIKCYGAVEDSTQTTSHADITLYSGTTQKGTTQKFTSSTNSVITISSPGTWTREELQSAKLRFAVGYYGGHIFGITWNVTYTTPSGYYWIYTLSNVSADHTILISDAIIEIPEEDPQYDYYPITISSINATTDPGRGTTRIVEGTNQTIYIYPSDPLLTLVTDNGVDVSSQLVQHGGTISDPSVATLSGASYGFTLNSGTGYYVSSNTGVDKSAAVCRVSFDLPVRCLVTIQYINYAEATYDFGVFGNIDTALSTSYYAAGSGGATITDSSYRLACNTSAYNTSSAQTLTYEIAAGQHYIDIKYSKDDGTSSNNDTLQWKITSIEALESNNYYTYTLSNISAAHSLIFIFGDVTYYFVNSSSSGARLFPSGSMVQLPGDSYRLTIVPDDYSYDITLLDNNVDRTAYVEKKEEEITKDGNTYTIVNYIYSLSNIQATHTIEVVCSTSQKLYIKINGSYVQASTVYKKVNGQWVEQTDLNSLFDREQVYISSI